MNKKIDVKTIWIGIICLTVIQIVAMIYGINGTFRTMVAIIIAAAIGITIPKTSIIR